MADPPPALKEGLVEEEIGSGKIKKDKDFTLEDYNMEEYNETSSDETDKSYVASEELDGMLESSEDGESYEDEEDSKAEELNELQKEAAEEERRALGGWTEESIEEFRREQQQEWVQKNYHVHQLSQSISTDTDVVRKGEELLPLQQNQNYQQQPCSVTATVGGADITDAEKPAIQVACSNNVEGDVMNLPNIPSGYSMQRNMAESNDVDARLHDPTFCGVDSLAATGTPIPAIPIFAISNEEAGLLDLYAAQPLQPTPEINIPPGQSLEAHRSLTSQSINKNKPEPVNPPVSNPPINTPILQPKLSKIQPIPNRNQSVITAHNQSTNKPDEIKLKN